MKVMITGGGTGGHTSPAVAIIEELQRRDPHLLVQWVGRRGSIEERVATAMAVPFRAVPVEGWPRRNRVRRLWSVAKLGLGYLRALLLVRKFHPDVVVAVGGYVSLPVGLAAQHLGVPVVLHEQNKRLGMANRLLAPKAARLLLSYPDTLGEYPQERARVVGNPVRAAFLRPPSPAAARSSLGLDPAIPVVLIAGGSQGAGSINQAAADMAPLLHDEEMQIVWAAGPAHAAAFRGVADTRPHIRLIAFIEDMATAGAAADIVVGRAGASSTAEIAVLGKPSILIPYPHATDNHQEQNARAFEAAGAAVVLLDHECSGARLLELLRDLLADAGRRARMATGALALARPEAVDAIAEELLALAFIPRR
jgi:UDP-N-acetylglucosamine--N-acetylmuramyl-(pentapeptide) pyrophosphoryl-undecaprenol N-acetylglucosamine transferase